LLLQREEAFLAKDAQPWKLRKARPLRSPRHDTGTGRPARPGARRRLGRRRVRCAPAAAPGVVAIGSGRGGRPRRVLRQRHRRREAKLVVMDRSAAVAHAQGAVEAWRRRC